ncbi:MAG TPA: tetratricopeptide repeat protein [Thermoanaerobaculia bacterium]|nr:tetratricopeptide repeat protein [Thermoanaerobaculia bacterium]
MTNRWKKLVAAGWLALLLNTAYIAALPSATLFYMGNVVLHLALGLALTVAVLLLWRRASRDAAAGAGNAGVAGAAGTPGDGGAADLATGSPAGAAAVWLLALAAAAGIALAVVGNTTPHRWLLWVHIGASALAVLAGLLYLRRRAAVMGSRGGAWPRLWRASAAAAAVLLLLPAAMIGYRRLHPDPAMRIHNPAMAPVSMDEEGGGPKSPFFPSSAKTNVGGIIPADFFTQSDTCGECHKDIYRQWKSSVHHFASFNNQFYRKSIEYMQDVVGTQPSKWCAGCHDHAVFFNGRFERPIKEQIDTEEARAGLACTSCHAITHVDSSMGNGGNTVAYPPLHELAASRNPVLRRVNHFLTYLNPEPHRETFMKPFMRLDSAEFCSGCHKVHLDVPVNHYRWFRGFNDYDAWQASGVSGQGARAFYYPKESKTCGGCHMPLVDSQDPGNKHGKVHSHRFAAANTALPFVNHDQEQLQVVEKFLKSGFLTVDIFAISPEDPAGPGEQMIRRVEDREAGPQLASTFAVGDEAQAAGPAILRDVGKLAAPLDAEAKRGFAARPGSTVRVDVVARTRTIGHFFPGGTVDAFDVWLELVGRDATGRVVYWSGAVEDGGKGPVEPGAHFYRSVQLDGAGNIINKRNAWQSRSVLYVRLIPPGAADVAHYRVHIPADARGPITFEARMNYRKFSHYYTQFAYAGQPKPGQPASLVDASHNSQEWTFTRANIPADVSGEIRGEIPDLPIVAVAQAKAVLPLAATTKAPGATSEMAPEAPGKAAGELAPAAAAAERPWQPVVRKEDRERWNDWGIGLLLQGDLKGAEYAFRRVTEAEPGYADGWVNVARALIREGEIDAARPFIDKALAINGKLARALFFRATIEKEAGDYDASLASLAQVEAQFPRDRVVLDQEARVLFLERRYAEALKVLDRVCMVDPEDLQMHYTAMLCHRALGHQEQAAREAALFRRFKAEESAQALTAERRQQSPEDNNERQAIHEHDSVRLPWEGTKQTTVAAVGAPAARVAKRATQQTTTQATQAATTAAAAPLARVPAVAAPVAPVAPRPAASEKTRAKAAPAAPHTYGTAGAAGGPSR